MNEKARNLRVAELIRQEIGKLLTKGLKDPRIGFVSVMSVRMSKDLRYANVYVSFYGSEKEKRDSLVGLERSTGWIRREIGKKVRLHHTPEIRFFEDDSLERVYHLEDVFQQIHDDEEKDRTMSNNSIADIVKVLRNSHSVLITTHVGPDGDGIGSMLALYYLVLAMGIEAVVCVNEDPVPEKYEWLPAAATVKKPETLNDHYDTVVILDVSSLDRIGTAAKLISDDSKVIIIDHHLSSSPCGDINFIDPSYAASGEIVVELFEEAGIPLTYEAAVCAYVAQTTDTGGFRFSNTVPRSHRIAAVLVEAGIDVADISARMFDLMPLRKFNLMKRFLEKVSFSLDGKVAYAELTADDISEFGCSYEDIDGLINYARNVEGVDVAVLLKEIDSSVTKVSFRSCKTFNSAEVLEEFGGGGHAAAAGVSLDLPLAEARKVLMKRVNAAFNNQ